MRIVYGIICLCFLIFFHELGHFLAAKLFGVKVEAFSIGFGPKLFHKTIKGTDYRISCVPLGGYCAMKGEKEFANSLNAGLDYIEAEKDSLYGVNKFKRILIAFAGPFFNFILAFFAFTTIAVTGYTYYTYSNKILIPDEIQYPDLHSAAKEAGIMSGDVILSVDSNKINDFNDLITFICPPFALKCISRFNSSNITYLFNLPPLGQTIFKLGLFVLRETETDKPFLVQFLRSLL